MSCKPKKEKTFRSLLGGNMLPRQGCERVSVFHEVLAEEPTTMNIAVKMLSHMFVMAEAWGMVADGVNPCQGVAKYPALRRERFQTDAEFEKLDRVLDKDEVGGSASEPAIAKSRLLILTCFCKEKILKIKREDVDLGVVEIKHLNSKAVRKFEAISRLANDVGLNAEALVGCMVRVGRDQPQLGGPE